MLRFLAGFGFFENGFDTAGKRFNLGNGFGIFKNVLLMLKKVETILIRVLVVLIKTFRWY